MPCKGEFVWTFFEGGTDARLKAAATKARKRPVRGDEWVAHSQVCLPGTACYPPAREGGALGAPVLCPYACQIGQAIPRSRCSARETILIGSSFHLRTDGNVLGEGAEDGVAVGGGGGEEHAVGFESAHFSRGEICDDDDLASDEVFRRVG